jgi:hypothetical protein
MKIPITVTIQGEPTTYTTNPWAILVWERKYNKTMMGAVNDGFSMEDLGFLAHTVAKLRSAEVPAKFEEFMQSLDELSVSEDESRPFPEGASEGLSPS